MKAGALLLACVGASQLSCASNAVCREQLHAKYFCHELTRTCKRLPLNAALDWKAALGLLGIFTINVFTVSFGISGSGLLYACIVYLLDFSSKDTIPLYKVSNLLGALTSLGFTLAKRKAGDRNALCVDWQLLAFSLPLLFAGSVLGIFFADFLPGIALNFFVAATLLYVFRKACATLRVIVVQRRMERSRRYEAMPKLVRLRSYESARPLVDLLYAQLPPIALVLLAFEIMNISAYSRGGTKLGSYLRVPSCSPLSFLLLGAATLTCGALALVFARPVRAGMDAGKFRGLALHSFLAGVVTTVGISGSVFYSSALLSADVEPLTTIAVSAVALFLSSLGTIMQFGYMGYLDAGNGSVVAAVSLLGSLAGNFLLKRHVPRGKVQRLIPEIICVVTFCTLLTLLFTGWYEFASASYFTQFGALCG